MALHLSIVSPEKTLYSGEAERVLLPGTKGAFEVLNNHAPIISSLGKGMLTYTVSGESRELRVSGGFVEVLRNEVLVCVTL